MNTSLSVRQLQPELMDNPALDDRVHRQALAGLRRINLWSRTDAVICSAVKSVWNRMDTRSRRSAEPLTILDIASGGGDLAIRLAKRFESTDITVRIQGCDISRTAIEYASEQARIAGLTNVQFVACDVLQQSLPQAQYDVVMCSLFLHHLTQPQSLKLLKIMKSAATRLLLVDDLRRTKIGYWLACLGCRVLSRSPIVHYDGPVSVAGAYSSNEAAQLAREAGLSDAQIRHHWPQRFLLSWSPASDAERSDADRCGSVDDRENSE